MNEIKVPAGATQIDARGQYLMPGLAEMHAHFLVARDSTEIERELTRGLARGITTIRVVDAQSRVGYATPRLLPAFKARAAAGQLWSPQIYASGPWGPPQYTGLLQSKSGRMRASSYGVSSNLEAPAPRLDSVAVYVAAYKAMGYDHIKVYYEQGELFDSLVAAAHRVGLPLIGHMRERAIAARYKSVEHGYVIQAASIVQKAMSPDSIQAFATAIQRAGVWTCPLLTLEGFLGAHLQGHNQLTKALQDAGAGLLLGTDAGGVGDVSGELVQLVQAGLTPYEALVTGTRNPAVYFGTLDETGTVALGKRADLVLLAGNPLEKISYTARPAGVMIGGRWLPRETIAPSRAAPSP